jgi:hypothetical protein
MADNSATNINWDEFRSQMEQMGKNISGQSTPSSNTVGSPAGYNFSTLQNQISTVQKKLDKAQGKLKNYYTDRYEEEFKSQGLGDIKNKITDIDSKIAGEKGTRDESISKTRQNPYYSAASITGESSEIERLANSKINNYVDERNSLAGTYNTTLDEVTKKVAAETAEKEREVDELKNNIAGLGKQMSDYQDMIKSELDSQNNEQRWEMEFMLKLQDANQKAKTGGGSAGERLSSRIEQGLEPDPTMRATAQRLMEQNVSDPTRLGYTGDLAVQLESEMNYIKKQSPQADSSSSAQKGITAESTFRREVRDAWKEGYSPEQLKQTYGNIGFSDSKKSPAEIIDDEWHIKTAPGIGGFLGRLFRIGV